MSQTNFEELFNKFLGETMTAEEIARFRNLFDEESLHSLRDQLLEAAFTNKTFIESGYYDPEEIFQQLLARIKRQEMEKKSETSIVVMPRYTRVSWFRYAAAAVLIVLLGATGYFFVARKRVAAPSLAVRREVLAPGGNRAILTLANGKSITLDRAQNGQLSQQGNSNVVKVDSGLLAYKTNQTGKQDVFYNTVTTPRGGQYQIILPDGTHAWLNSASSLTFPTAFTGKYRQVILTGEGYFEVVHNAVMPFVVQAGDQELKVLGTRFNINAYPGEAALTTTLLEGSVRLANARSSVLINPGEQAQLSPHSGFKVIEDADQDVAIAWKNGFFSFRHADIQTVMRQLSRWYDIEVQYQGDANGDLSFSGEIGRDLSLSDVLNGLQLAKIRYRIEEGRRLVILP